MAFRNQLQIRLAGLEENFDLPPFPIDPDDLFLRQFRICADKSDPVFFVLLVPNADNPGRNFLVFTNHDSYGEKVFASAAALFTDAENLIDGELLSFIKETVTPDYDKFVNVAKQYGDDAGSFGDSSENIAQMVENIRASMEEVSKAIQNIAESTQDTADLSSRVNDSVMVAADVVSNVNEMTNKQEAVAGTLEEIVRRFKLK